MLGFLVFWRGKPAPAMQTTASMLAAAQDAGGSICLDVFPDADYFIAQELVTQGKARIQHSSEADYLILTHSA